MALRKLGKDPHSPNGNSATVYLDEETSRYYVQGDKVLDEDKLAQMDIPPHETAVEIPRYMASFFLPEDTGHGADPAELEGDKGAEAPDV